MTWRLGYDRKRIAVEDAVRLIDSGERMYVSGNAATPTALLQELAERPDVEDVEVVHVLMLGRDPLSEPAVVHRFRHNSLFVGPADREAVNSGRADYVPIFLHRIGQLFDSGRLPLDWAVLQVSPPDQHGYMSLGVEVLASKEAARNARRVIVQVNESMPRVLGDGFLHVSEVDHIVELNHTLPELLPPPPTELENAIARNVAGLIEDGATLQLGIGGIPDAVLRLLEGKKNLGVHTEMISDGVMRAIQSGLVTGALKSVHPGKVIATFVMGSSALYEFVHDNPTFELHPAAYTNDPFMVAQNRNMVAINSALEVDITGQVCADSIGTYIYSGFGGQVDFVRGAQRSQGGKAIIALPSTARRDSQSRICGMLKAGAGVVTTRADVHYIVTEYGVADLFGKNLRQRAEELIAIAHPDFRAQLEQEARERKLIPAVFAGV
ncbi:MAG TPA: acetyl-CoA hydrolase/transferase C-terminal domain-containing protein [Longimicrobiales bacterium]|nr:acetyl-CoA hydrolase/transferase C-terminal domain-containing protein [Longimicrobiales bacterium]